MVLFREGFFENCREDREGEKVKDYVFEFVGVFGNIFL